MSKDIKGLLSKVDRLINEYKREGETKMNNKDREYKNEKRTFEQDKKLQPTINIGYSWRIIENMIDNLTWRLDDELVNREFHKVKGGHFGKMDWISKSKTDFLEELQTVFIECRKLMKPHTIYDGTVETN